MKHAFIIFSWLVFSLYGMAQGEQINQLDANGKKHGIWEQQYPNEQLRYRGQFEHGEPVGSFFYYLETGEKSAQVDHLEDGKAEATFFHKNGTIKGKGSYRDEEKQGLWKFYDNHAILSSEEPFENGKLNGTVRVYHLNNQLAAEIPYEQGLKNGPFVEYSTNGNVRIEGTYADNTFDGEYKQYYEDGSIYMSGYYKAAVKDSIWKYYDDDGHVKYQELYDTGTLLKRKVEEGYKREQVDMEIKEEDILDEQQLMDEFMNGTPPR